MPRAPARPLSESSAPTNGSVRATGTGCGSTVAWQLVAIPGAPRRASRTGPDVYSGAARDVGGGRWRRMDGVHDMGGMHGFGAVVREADEPVFHAPWER